MITKRRVLFKLLLYSPLKSKQAINGDLIHASGLFVTSSAGWGNWSIKCVVEGGECGTDKYSSD